MSSARSMARVWNAVLAAVVGGGIVLQLVLIFASGDDANADENDPDAGTAVRLVRMFSYFTVQSNVLVLIAAVTLLVNPARDGRAWRVLRLDSLLGIVITGVVYASVLAGKVEVTGAALVANIAFHYVSPPLAFVGWLLFGPRPRIDTATMWLAFAWPVAWVVYTLVHGAATDWYPYYFLDVNEIGYASAVRNTAFVVLVAMALAFGARALDRRMRPAPLGGAGVRSRRSLSV